jgi:hypothetical protein
MNVHRQRSRGTGVLVVGAGDAPHPGVSLLRGVSDAVSWPRVGRAPARGRDDPEMFRNCSPGGTSARTRP